MTAPGLAADTCSPYNRHMETHRASSASKLARIIATELRAALEQGQKVLWLVCGGSNIAVASAVCPLLDGLELSELSVTLTDERYGPVGHPDSNWQQLQDVGFRLPGARLVPVLGDGLSLADTTAQFATSLEQLTHEADTVIGLFGLGPDGHTAGILPGSPAVGSPLGAIGYVTEQFTRITMGPCMFERLDLAYLGFEGTAKTTQIARLGQDLSPEEQPVQYLKRAGTLMVYHIESN
jgi:6-phosphogluconolactonase/glucosamine-6-phosphate isomerase/deaminase